MGAAFRRLTPSKIDLKVSSLVWLDDSVNTLPESIDAQQRIRAVSGQLKAFENVDDCVEHIQSLPENNRIIVIVSGRLGQNFVQNNDNCEKIVAFYVYCGDKQKHETWARQYPKVRGLAVSLNELIRLIRSDQEQEEQKENNDPLTFISFNPKASKEKMTVGLNGQFLHSQVLIDCLLQIESTNDDKTELISICNENYQNNQDELKMIREFNGKYSSREALKWYTRESFVYRTLNKALREQNIHLIFLLRFLIRDIQNQLKDNRCSSRLTVYRGQYMWPEELQVLKASKGQLLAITSFFSTSLKRQSAYKFLVESAGLERVLFEINADPEVLGAKPFAEISKLSYFPKEEEVLFMLGSIFRLDDITHDRNDVWTLRLSLSSLKDPDLEANYERMKAVTQQGNLSLVTLGSVLHRMGKYDDAERYYRRCLDKLPNQDFKNISLCCHELEDIDNDKGNYDKSLKWFNRALENDKNFLQPNDPQIGKTHNSMANVFISKGDYKRALESYSKALKIFQSSYGDDNLDVASCLNNIGIIREKEQNYKEALDYYQEALAIRERHLPAKHSDLGDSHNNIGILYRHAGRADKALEELNCALDIYQRTLPSDHKDIAMTLESIGGIYEENGNYKKALEYYKNAADIYHQTLSKKHQYVIDIEQSIDRVSSKLK